MNRPLAIFAAVMLAHYGYLTVDEQAQSWAFYIMRGVEGVVLGLALLGTFPPGVPRIVGTAVCWLLIFEEGQTAVCGYLASGGSPNGLCVEVFGGNGYALLICVAAACIAWKRERA